MDVVDKAKKRRAGVLFVVIAAVLWSTGGVGVKVIGEGAQPLVVAGLRSVFAFAFMLIVLIVQMKRAGGASSGVILTLLRRPLVWAAAFSYALMVTMFVLAARRTTAANAIFIQYTGPVYVAVLSGPMLGEKVARRDLLAIGACIVGMALAFGGELGEGKMSGNILALISSFGFAGLPLLLRMDQNRMLAAAGAREDVASAATFAPLACMTLGNALAALVALPAICMHPPNADTLSETMLVLFLLGTLQIGLPYVFFAAAVKRLRALEAALIATVEPVLAPIWVLFATGERPSAMAAAGGAVIVSAVITQTLSHRRPPA